MSDQQHPGTPPAGDPRPPYGTPDGPYDAPTGYPAPGGFVPAGGPTPYGYDPVTGAPWSDKSRTTAGLLSLLLPFVGVCGVGRLYTGQVAIGLAQLLGFFAGVLLTVVLVGFVVFPAVWIWSVVDGVVLLTSGGKDQYGRPLR